MPNDTERMELREQHKQETGKNPIVNPVCEGERNFATWDYLIWLEDKVTKQSEEIEALKERGSMNRILVDQQAKRILRLEDKLSRIKEGVKGLKLYQVEAMFDYPDAPAVLKQDLDNLMEGKK